MTIDSFADFLEEDFKSMEKKIEIKNIEKSQIDNNLEVIYKIAIKGKEYDLTYKISGGIETVPLLCDAVVVGFLVYAVRFGLSFYSEYPISEKLYYNLTKHAIPQMSVANKTENDMIRLDMPITKEVYHGNWVGTGISLGVDSFTTIHEYVEDCDIDEYKLTHLVHLKTGAHHGQLGYYDQQKEDELFSIENTKVRRFCEERGYKLIVIESNLYEITCKEFGYGFSTTHTFRNLGCILLLQNLFSKYYYASAYNLDKFVLNLGLDTASYEKWAMPYISNDSLEFYSANTNMTRIQKTMYISKFADTYDNLHVCWHEKENCGQCKKCIRTLVTLDILGVLDKYSNSFNLEQYYKNRSAYISEVILMRNIDSSYMEIYKYMLECKFKMPSLLNKTKTAFKIARLKIKKLGFINIFKFVSKKLMK